MICYLNYFASCANTFMWISILGKHSIEFLELTAGDHFPIEYIGRSNASCFICEKYFRTFLSSAAMTCNWTLVMDNLFYLNSNQLIISLVILQFCFQTVYKDVLFYTIM